MKSKETSGDDSRNNPAVIHPIPWENAPAANFSTQEFTKCLEDYKEYMNHFAMHTPHFFIAHNTAPTFADDSNDEVMGATHVRKRALVTKQQKAVSASGQGRTEGDNSYPRGRKRKALEEG